jgi:nitrate/TMAO reductase-like tetraheme cytochrome c subunit
MLRNWWQRIRAITLRQLAQAALTLVVFLLIAVGFVYAWDYTNGSFFCGTTCHPMPPHYQSYLRSPHARVQCVECHIGRTFVGVAFTRKATDVQYVVNYLTNNYQFPIYAQSVQPARESCEKCHWPEKFSWDKIVTLTRFASDKTNTPIQTVLALKVGGGTQREGLGRGIHWHIENAIDFAYTDEQKQVIPYIEVTNRDGSKQIYIDIETKLTAAELAQLPRRRMDCIDCHNRVSHNFQSPDAVMDHLLATQQIAPTIPEIKQKGVQLLAENYASREVAKQAIANLESFYKQNYADYAAKNSSAIQQAITKLQEWSTQIRYPEQGLDWTTHLDNIGHKDAPGCFRCHDGKHFTPDRQQAIRLECNICHTIPEVVTPGGPAPVISITRGDEPASHRKTTWLAEHRTVFDTSCQQCHDTNNAGGKDNSSFCSNSACHGTVWKFAGLNAPALAEIVKAPLRPPSAPGAQPRVVPHPVGGNPDCQVCHGAQSKVRPYPADHVGRANTTCLTCHPAAVSGTTPTPAPTSATAPVVTPAPTRAVSGPPTIPHDVVGRTQCLGCHGSGVAGVRQIPSSHKDARYTNDMCVTCHKPKLTVAPTPAAQPTVLRVTKGEKLPADHTGRTICLACHAAGVGKKLPADHAGRTDDTCRACHQ